MLKTVRVDEADVLATFRLQAPQDEVGLEITRLEEANAFASQVA